MDDGVALDDVLHELDRAGAVGHRRGIRHHHHGGEPAGGRGLRTGGDRLLVGLARLAEVNMDVDQPRAGHQAAGIDLAGALLRDGGKRGNESAVADEDVADRIPLGGRVDDAGILNPERGHGQSAEWRTANAKWAEGKM